MTKYILTETQHRLASELRQLREEMNELGANMTPAGGTKWRADVAGKGEANWSNNGMEYNTSAEAKNWLDGLAGRWFGYDMSRVVPANTPRREAVDPNDPTIYQNYRK
jgi:hypothetical protein